MTAEEELNDALFYKMTLGLESSVCSFWAVGGGGGGGTRGASNPGPGGLALVEISTRGRQI
jgi:hypothetical protein